MPTPPTGVPMPTALSALLSRLSLPPNTTLHPVLLACLTHPSFTSQPSSSDLAAPEAGDLAEFAQVTTETNEVLASLGNSLLGLFASEHLATQFPLLPSTALKEAVTAYVGPKACMSVARELGLGTQNKLDDDFNGVGVRWRRSTQEREESIQSTPIAKRFEKYAGEQKGHRRHDKKDNFEDVVSGVVKAFVGLIYREKVCLLVAKSGKNYADVLGYTRCSRVYTCPLYVAIPRHDIAVQVQEPKTCLVECGRPASRPGRRSPIRGSGQDRVSVSRNRVHFFSDALTDAQCTRLNRCFIPSTGIQHWSLFGIRRQTGRRLRIFLQDGRTSCGCQRIIEHVSRTKRSQRLFGIDRSLDITSNDITFRMAITEWKPSHTGVRGIHTEYRCRVRDNSREQETTSVDRHVDARVIDRSRPEDYSRK
jgi:dsRNA-specific ribonuclease